jgi:hypothetical protein
VADLEGDLLDSLVGYGSVQPAPQKVTAIENFKKQLIRLK